MAYLSGVHSSYQLALYKLRPNTEGAERGYEALQWALDRPEEVMALTGQVLSCGILAGGVYN